MKLTEEKPFALAVSDIAKMHMHFLTKLRYLPDLSSLLYQHEWTQAHTVLQSPLNTLPHSWKLDLFYLIAKQPTSCQPNCSGYSIRMDKIKSGIPYNIPYPFYI